MNRSKFPAQALRSMRLSSAPDFCFSDSITVAGMHLQDIDLSEAPAPEEVSIEYSKVERLSLSDVTIDRWEMMESEICRSNWATLTANRISISSCHLYDMRLTGSHWIFSSLHDSAIVGSKCNLGKFFTTRFKNVLFKHCDFTETSFQNCRFENVRFQECTLNECRFTESSFKQLDLRGSKINGLVMDPKAFKDLTIDPTQCETFAKTLGLHVLPSS